MQTASPSSSNRRSNTISMVDKLVKARNEVWTLYGKVAENRNGEDSNIQAVFVEFRQLLVDYIALGHFGMYQRIIEHKERRQAVVDLAEEIYPQIAQTTDVALKFNDQYEAEIITEISDVLKHDLSGLGEALAVRIDLEDQLCETMVR